MGRSLIGGLLANGFPDKNICAVDLSEAQRQIISEHFGIEAMADAGQALKGADVVVVAVKPQSMQKTLTSIAAFLAKRQPLLISVAAGIETAAIAHWIGTDLAIVRAMPNTPSLLRTGAAGLFANARVNENQRTMAESIMRAVGMTIWVDKESLLDTVTALSGSGPAYFFYFMEIMEKTGINLGLTEEQARNLVLQTALGAAKMALESDLDPHELRNQVTSPGGTTEKAIAIMQEHRLEEIIQLAIEAAAERSRELARTLGDHH